MILFLVFVKAVSTYKEAKIWGGILSSNFELFLVSGHFTSSASIVRPGETKEMMKVRPFLQTSEEQITKTGAI